MREIVDLILQDSFNSVSICDHWYLLTIQKAQLNATFNRLHQMEMIFVQLFIPFKNHNNSVTCRYIQ